MRLRLEATVTLDIDSDELGCSGDIDDVLKCIQERIEDELSFADAVVENIDVTRIDAEDDEEEEWWDEDIEFEEEEEEEEWDLAEIEELE